MTIEYLDLSDWSLKTIDGDNEAAPDDWLLVPGQAIKATIDRDADIYFWDKHGFCSNAKEWPLLFFDPDSTVFAKFMPVIIWQRATHPEPLPFIDDEITDNKEPPRRVYFATTIQGAEL